MSRRPPNLSQLDSILGGSTRPAEPLTREERVAAWGELAEAMLDVRKPLHISKAVRLLIGGAILASLADPKRRPAEVFLQLNERHNTRTAQILWASHLQYRKKR